MGTTEEDTTVDLLAQVKQEPDLHCYYNFLVNPYPPTHEGQVYCNSTWDTISCLPTTLGGTVMQMKCPANLEGYQLDPTHNATRFCYPNGTWENKTDYSRCYNKNEEFVHSVPQLIIYLLGFGTSTIALTVAVIIFLYFKSLRCLRNTIHCHLMISFILRNLCWIIFAGLLSSNVVEFKETWICKSVITMYNYFQVTNFFWMFIEGFYLHTLIVWAFAIEKIKLWFYVVIGWVLPLPFVVIWVILKYNFKLENDASCWMPQHDVSKERFDWLFIVPNLVVLLVNLIFLATIVWVLITKLQASFTHETHHTRKAVKATLILVPLLGLTYVLFISAPIDDPTTSIVFAYINAVLLSTQGFAVALFYCFLNGEVKACIQKKFHRWKDSRSITTRWTKASSCSMATRQSFARSSATHVPLTIAEHGDLNNGKRRDSNWNAKTGSDDNLQTLSSQLMETDEV